MLIKSDRRTGNEVAIEVGQAMWHIRLVRLSEVKMAEPSATKTVPVEHVRTTGLQRP